MNKPFIKTMCESYYSDKYLKNLNIWKNKDVAINDIYENVDTTFNELYYLDYDLFKYITEQDYGYKQDVIYKLINSYINETYNKDTLDLIYNIDDDIKYDPIKLYEYIDDLDEKLSGTKLINEELWTGSLLTIILTYSAYSLIKNNWGTISKKSWEIVSDFNDLTQSIAELVKDKTKSSRVKKIIFLENAEECWKQCGIEPNKLKAFVGSVLNRMHSNNFTNMFSDDDDIKQADCLGSCYIKWCIEQAAELAKAYALCLSNTGNIGNNLDAIQLWIQPPSFSQCEDYRKVLKKHKKSFDEVLEIIFGYHLELIERYKQLYEKSISDGLAVSKNRKINYKSDPKLKSSIIGRYSEKYIPNDEKYNKPKFDSSNQDGNRYNKPKFDSSNQDGNRYNKPKFNNSNQDGNRYNKPKFNNK